MLAQIYEKLGLGGVLGLIVGLIGIFFAFYFYSITKKEKLPVYAYTETIELDATVIPNIKILFKDKKEEAVLPRVASTKIVFFNKGRESIKSADLEIYNSKLLVEVPPSYKILSIEVLNRTPKASDLDVKPVRDKNGNYTNKAIINFKILEKDEGALFQIVHTGTRTTVPKISGNTEGVKKGVICLGKSQQSKEQMVPIIFLFGYAIMFTALIFIPNKALFQFMRLNRALSAILFGILPEKLRQTLLPLEAPDLDESKIRLRKSTFTFISIALWIAVLVLLYNQKGYYPAELDPFK